MSGYLYSSLPLWPLLLYSLKIIFSDILKVNTVFVCILVIFLLMVYIWVIIIYWLLVHC